MTNLVTAAREVLVWLDRHGWEACLIGGLAIQRWGEPRLTQDVDVTVVVPVGQEPRLLDAILTGFEIRRLDARAFALQYRVLLLRAACGVAIDLALGGSAFEAGCVQRSSTWEIEPGCAVRTCSAEDLIILKLVAGRPRDVADIEGVVARQGPALDTEWIRRWATAFSELKEDSDLVRPFEAALARSRSTN